MIGLYSGAPGGNVTVEAEGSDRIPSTTGEVASAAFGSAFAANPTPRLVRGIETGRIPLSGSDLFPEDAQLREPEPMLGAEDANKRYGIKGKLAFDKDVSERSARDLYETKRAELVREDTIRRSGGGFGSGGLARFGVGAVAGLLDPINVASAFLPVVPAARVGVALAGAAGAAGRAGVRVGVGAAEGAAGQLALEPLQYALDQQEQNDWTMADALKRVAFGAVLGGGLHVVGGAVADRVTGKYANPVTERLERAGPVAREDGLRGSVAALAEDRPVNVAPVFEMADARATASSLGRAVEDYAALRGQADMPSTAATVRPDQVLEQLREQVPGFRPDIEPVRAEAPAAPIAERVTDQAAPARVDETSATQAPERIDPATAPEAAVGAEPAPALRNTGEQALPVQQPTTAAARALRDELWAKLRAGDTTEAGVPSSLLTEARANMDAGAIKTRPDFEQFLDGYNARRIAAAVDDVAQRVRAVEADAMARLRESAARPPGDALDVGAARQAVELAERAPKAEGPLDAQLAEVTKLVDDLTLRVDTEAAAGRLAATPETVALAEARAAVDLAEGNARAYEAAAACLVTRG